MSTGYRERMAGESNPYYSNAGARKCSSCGAEYASYKKDRKFCSAACYVASKPRAPKYQFALKLVKPAAETKPKRSQSAFACQQCSNVFTAAPSSARKFCSYQCHLDSGGAFRAGMASAAATMRYGPKKDANHNEIMDEMRKHCSVFDLSTAGNGIPDGIAWVNEAWQLFDIKNQKTGYGRRGLNAIQKKWIAQWQGGPVYLIHTTEEARRFAHGNFDGLKREESGYAAKAETKEVTA